MNNMFFFDKMLTPKIITVVYWFFLVSAVISGISSMLVGYEGFTLSGFFMGILIIAGSAVAIRIWCELLIVLFKMNEALQELRNR